MVVLGDHEALSKKSEYGIEKVYNCTRFRCLKYSTEFGLTSDNYFPTKDEHGISQSEETLRLPGYHVLVLCISTASTDTVKVSVFQIFANVCVLPHNLIRFGKCQT